MAMKEIKSDLSKRGASTDIIDTLNATTEPANSKPDRRPTRVPIDMIDFNRSENVFETLSAFLA